MQDLTPDEQITLATYNNQAARWTSGHDQPSFWQDEITRFSGLLPKGRIIDIGAGGGRDASLLIEQGYDYLGTDISSGLLEQARKTNPGVKFEQVSLYDMNYAEPFDGFWCAAVLLHIPRDRTDQALKSIKSTIKPGGVGFFAVKQGEGQKMETDDKNTQDDKRLFVYWSDQDFTAKLVENGFEVLDRGYKFVSERSKWLTYFVRVK